MKNLGKANVYVEILDGLPGINKDSTKYNFDVTAYNWNIIKNSHFFNPLLTEQVSDEMDQFAAMFPQRRKRYIDNFLRGSAQFEAAEAEAGASDDSLPFISFTPIQVGGENDTSKSPLVKQLFLDGKFDKYTLKQPEEYENDSEYIGPKWKEALLGNIKTPNDAAQVAKWWKELGLQGTPPSDTNDGEEKTLYYLNQRHVRDGLAWAVESDAFLTENQPFWINLRIARTPPTADKDTFFVISLGVDSVENAFDIYLAMNNRTQIVDYYKGRAAPSVPDTGLPSTWTKSFDTDFARLLDDQEEIEIGIMTIAGRLIVWMNQTPLIYNRIERESGDNNGKFKECKIAPGKIQIFGSNVQALINVCPMVFAPLSAVALPIPTIIRDSGGEVEIPYQGVKSDGTFGGSVCLLPQQGETKDELYGVDCWLFQDTAGTESPEGVGLHRQGWVKFMRAISAGIKTLPKKDPESGITTITAIPNPDFYVLYMVPQDTVFAGRTLPNGGCPYFFRIKGGYQKPAEELVILVLAAEDVISASQSVSAPDYFHSLATANVTLYNKNAKYDFLKHSQHGIVVKWGWNGQEDKTFTGIITGATTSETAGMETITLTCEDYMHILKNTPIVNSPFYDGMVAYYAIQDLAQRGGILNFVRDWEEEQDFFLRAGYAFSKPLIRFSAKQMLFECMINIVQQFEAFIYFDENGALHINKLPGGLFSSGASDNFVATFTRNPDADPATIILDEKQIEYSFASTVNRINIWTLDRDTRNTILYTKSAKGAEDHVLYRRLYLRDDPALGDIEVARTYAERLGQRIFYPIRKSGFKTIGSVTGEGSTTIANVFDFIKIDGDEFRLMSLNRTYDANDNSFMSEYGVEWLGGK